MFGCFSYVLKKGMDDSHILDLNIYAHKWVRGGKELNYRKKEEER